MFILERTLELNRLGAGLMDIGFLFVICSTDMILLGIGLMDERFLDIIYSTDLWSSADLLRVVL